MKKTETTPTKQQNILPYYRDGKNKVLLTPKKGEVMDTCATINSAYVCCNVKVIKTVKNCPFDCSYCFLQNYLNDGTTTAIADTDAVMAEVLEKTSREPSRFFRIGTWELGDSLALEDKIGQAKKLIAAFTGVKNAVLELKTKSDCVDSILNIDHQGKTVVSWSLNTSKMIEKEEHKTASLEKRLIAIEKVAKAGYLLGFHFDPMIMDEGWQDGYREVVSELAKIAPPSQIAWISMGSLRFNPEQKREMENNFPASTLTAAEMVRGDDNKIRYVKPIRIEMYRHLFSLLQDFHFDQTLLYLCMERSDMWDKIFGYHPNSIEDLDYRFAESLYHRFPGLVPTKPERQAYLKVPVVD